MTRAMIALVVLTLGGPAFADDAGLKAAFLAGSSNDCPGCDLTRTNLTYRDLTGANLEGANLTKARLHRAC